MADQISKKVKVKSRKSGENTGSPLPAGWKMTTLGEVAEVNNFIVDRTYPFEEIEYIDVASVEERRLMATKKLKLENAPSRAKRIVKDNSILISTVRPNLKHYCYIYKSKPNLVASTGFAVVNAKDGKSDPYFLYNLLTTKEFTDFLIKVADSQTSTYPAFNPSIILSSKFEIPEFPEQRMIAAVLSSFDDKIELLREQNKTLEATAQAIFKEWFVNFNFPDKKGKPYKKSGGKMIASELGNIPEGWRVGKLGEEFEIIMGQSPIGKSYNEQGDGMIFFQGRAEFQDRFPKTRLYTTEPKRMAIKFDVLVSVRAPVGDINVAFGQCCIGRGLAAVRGKEKSYTLYKIKLLKEVFDKFEAEGTVFGSINKDSFSNIAVIIPSKQEVERFETTVSSMDKKILNNYSQIQTLSTLRDTLLPKLMKGEVRISL